MSDSQAGLRKKITEAGELQSVVRTMKAVAASNIGQYEKSVNALTDYSRTVELGLGTCFRKSIGLPITINHVTQKNPTQIFAVVFGSDQGLVGQFNDLITDYAVKTLSALPIQPQIWAIGDHVHARLTDSKLPLMGLFKVPNSIKAIAPLVGQILLESEKLHASNEGIGLYLFYNRPTSAAAYTPASQHLLPLDESWINSLIQLPWPTKKPPEIMNDLTATLRALIREYLFVSIFRACAESLSSENSSRLAAMQRAEKNIEELLDDLNGKFHRLRQSSIDEELFDVISSFEALKPKE